MRGESGGQRGAGIAVLAEDGDGAERVMREHVRLSHQALMAGMDERQA